MENGNNTYFTIKLRKVDQVSEGDDGDMTDDLIGEYRYLENGAVQVNTLNQFNNTSISHSSHHISGVAFKPTFIYPRCQYCQEQYGDSHLVDFY